jgi:hypothetical protein
MEFGNALIIMQIEVKRKCHRRFGGWLFADIQLGRQQL